MEIKLKNAILFEPNALPTPSGKLINLDAHLDVTSLKGKQQTLTLTLKGGFVEIKAGGGTGLIPLTAFKMLVPLAE